MMITDFIFYFGLLHFACYALLGFAFTVTWTGEKIIKRAGIAKAMVHAYFLYHKDKHEKSLELEVGWKNDDRV